jgi:hypothetical protein
MKASLESRPGPRRSFFLFGMRGVGKSTWAKQALSSRDFAGLKAIGELKNVRRRVLVFLGDRPHCTEDGVDVLPVRHFIAEVEAGRT